MTINSIIDRYTIYNIIIFIIILYIVYNRENLMNITYFDKDSNYQYILNPNSKEIINDCFNYNCNKLKSKYDNIYLIAIDENNKQIFIYKNVYYTLENNMLIIISINDKKLTYYTYPYKIPYDALNNKLIVNLTYQDYTYVGLLNNNFYNQEYILYEKPYDKDTELNEKLYYYILVKIIENIYTIIYTLPPRQKILPSENIWVTYGTLQIGPLIFN